MNKERMELAIDILLEAHIKQTKFNNEIYGRKTLFGTSVDAVSILALDDRTELEYEWYDIGFFTRMFRISYLEVSYDESWLYEKAISKWLDIDSDVGFEIFADANHYYKDYIAKRDITALHVIKLLDYYLKNQKLPETCSLSEPELIQGKDDNPTTL